MLVSSGIDIITIEAEAGMFQTIFQKLEEERLEISKSYLLLPNLVNCAHTLAIKLLHSNLINILLNKKFSLNERESLLIGI